MEDLKLEGMIDVDLGFGEIIKVRANGIKYIEIDSDYVFTIHYDNGTTQKVPTIYKDFPDYPLASSSSNGLMSASDKTKLDNLDSTISTAISNALAKYDNADTTAY